MHNILDTKPYLLECDYYIIEKQPNRLNPMMQNISVALLSYFVMKTKKTNIYFNNAGTKLKLNEPLSKEYLKDAGKNKYKITKKLGIGICRYILNFETDNYILGVMILKKCEELLKGKGCNLIVAPMNGNTWKKYRTLSYTNGDPSFLLENVNPIEHNEILKEAGFKKMYTYTSTKGKIEDYVESPVLDILEKRMKEKKITIRNFDKNKYIEDLKKIYNVALPSFYKNPFYTPISEDDFLAQYIPYISMFDEELILIAEQDGKTEERTSHDKSSDENLTPLSSQDQKSSPVDPTDSLALQGYKAPSL